MYALEILRQLKKVTKAICQGCNFIDHLGFKGHPSQRRHYCVMWDIETSLRNCFIIAFMMAGRRKIAIEFLKMGDRQFGN